MADSLLPFEDRVDTVTVLCKEGYAGEMAGRVLLDRLVRRRGPRQAVLPKWTLTHIADDVLVVLRARGVAESHVKQMMVENPRPIVEHGEAY